MIVSKNSTHRKNSEHDKALFKLENINVDRKITTTTNTSSDVVEWLGYAGE